MNSDQIERMRDKLAEAHRCILAAQLEPAHSPTEDALIDAVQMIGMVLATLVDVMADREPMTETEFSEKVMEGKL